MKKEERGSSDEKGNRRGREGNKEMKKKRMEVRGGRERSINTNKLLNHT